MRKIDTIVVHHSFTPKALDVDKTIQSISRNHQERLHQPQSRTGLYVAYHYIIGKKGKMVHTRMDDEIGYHASNWPINERSIGICLLGQFDTEKPDPEQMWALRDLIKAIKAKYVISTVAGHRKYSTKTCPGNNVTDAMLEAAFHPKA